MNQTWDQFTFANTYFTKWLNYSVLGRSMGLLKEWYQASFLLQYSELISTFLICLIVVLAPFVSTTLIGILLLAGASFWFILILSEPAKKGFTPIHFLLLLYWGISTIAVAFSPLKVESISGWIQLTIYLILFAISARVFRYQQFTNWIIAAYLLVSLVVSGYGVRQEFIGVKPLATWNDPTSVLAQDTRVYSYLGNPNLLAGYLIPAVAFSVAAFFVWKTIPQKALALFMFICNLSCLFFTDSRGGWIGAVFLFTALFLGLYYWWRDYLSPFWRTWLLPIVFGGCALVIGVGVILVEPLRLRIFSIFSGRGDSSNNFRINVWIAVLKMIKDYPLTGIGLGHDVFNKIYPSYMQTNYTALSAYSIFLEIAVETGLIGFFCFLWLIVVTFNNAIKSIVNFRFRNNIDGIWMIAAIAAITGMLTHGLVDTVWFRPQINTIWWIVMGLIASNIKSN